jgi:integrase
MASIRLHGLRWQARVRRKGHRDEVRSFTTRQDAERWSRSVETEMDRGTFVSLDEAYRVTLSDLIARYIRDVIPGTKSEVEDTIRLKALQRRSIAKLSAATLTPERIAKHRDERLQTVSAGTVIRELAYLSSIINHARREWGINIQNPVALVKKPTAPKGRERTFSPDELDRLFCELRPKDRRSPWMHAIVIIALETAMRRSEILSLRWVDVDLHRRVAQLHDTKNGERRSIPLSSKAHQILTELPRSINGVVFPMTFCAVSAAIKRAFARAGIADARFHDLRHTAITEMAKKLPNVIELSSVTGHRSLKMLQRYYHPNIAELAFKLG